MNDSRPPRPKRRWYQFRLRTLLVVTLVLAVLFAWVGTRVQRAKRNREAVAEINGVKDSLWQRHIGTVLSFNFAEEPDWVGRLVGDPGVVRGVAVHTLSRRFDDAALEHVIGVTNSLESTNLELLHLSYTQVTDAGLKHLKGLTNLEELYLSRTQVTDAGLVHLKGLTNLRELYLNDTKVTDEGVKRLQEALPKCNIRHYRLPSTHSPVE